MPFAGAGFTFTAHTARFLSIDADEETASGHVQNRCIQTWIAAASSGQAIYFFYTVFKYKYLKHALLPEAGCCRHAKQSEHSSTPWKMSSSTDNCVFASHLSYSRSDLTWQLLRRIQNFNFLLLANEVRQSCFGFVTNPICHPIKYIQIQIVLSLVKQLHFNDVVNQGT